MVDTVIAEANVAVVVVLVVFISEVVILTAD